MNNQLEIKVCGINDVSSMHAALKHGADYIGLVYYDKSPRNVSLNFSKSLISQRTKKSKIVALTVNPVDNFLLDLKNEINPDFIQLHGDETANRCLEIKKKVNIPIIKGLHVKNRSNLEKITKEFEEVCDILLLDAPSESLPGGNGKQFNWDILKNYNSKTKWMLAGGLNIGNIKRAIDITKAPAVDISSGLEFKQGFKDPKLIEKFIIKCRNL